MWITAKSISSHSSPISAYAHQEFAHIGEEEQKTINTDVNEIKQLISSAVPTDREGIDALKTELRTLIERVKNLAQTPVVPSFESASDMESGDGTGEEKRLISKLVMIPSAPASVTSSSEADVKIEGVSKTVWFQNLVFWPDADGRLRTFYISSYIGSVIMLASVGFSSLYADNPANARIPSNAHPARLRCTL